MSPFVSIDKSLEFPTGCNHAQFNKHSADISTRYKCYLMFIITFATSKTYPAECTNIPVKMAGLLSSYHQYFNKLNFVNIIFL